MSRMTDPASRGAAVTPSDSTELGPTRALYVGTTGNLVVAFEGGTTTVTIPDAPVGYHPLRVRKVMAATTASGIVAPY